MKISCRRAKLNDLRFKHPSLFLTKLLDIRLNGSIACRTIDIKTFVHTF